MPGTACDSGRDRQNARAALKLHGALEDAVRRGQAGKLVFIVGIDPTGCATTADALWVPAANSERFQFNRP